jgi:ABC-type polysaccharide/polyol phosphate export permease
LAEQLKKQIYDSTKRKHPAVEEFLALFQYKDLVFQLAKRNIITRYKRSVLGIAWTMLNPLGTMIVMSLVFSHIFDRTESYPVYLLSGLVGWQFFSQTTSGCMNSMLWGSGLFQRSYLPKGAFVVSSILSGIINLLFSLVPLALIMVFTKVSFSISLIMLPFSILILACFALGIGLFLSSFVTVFPDLSEMYPVILTAWMYLTPIIVPEGVLQNVLNGWLLKANPLYHILRLMRMVIYDGIFPTGQQWLIATCIALFTLLLGWFIFTKRADSYGYRV